MTPFEAYVEKAATAAEAANGFAREGDVLVGKNAAGEIVSTASLGWYDDTVRAALLAIDLPAFMELREAARVVLDRKGNWRPEEWARLAAALAKLEGKP